MEVQEFGKKNSRKIMLLPGNMMSWCSFAKKQKTD